VLQVEGRVEEVMFDHLHATAFQYSPLSRTILGPAENIHTITQADLKSYIGTHYTGPRMVLAAAGAVQHDELVRTAQESFKNLSTNPITAGELVKKEPAFFTGSEVRFRDDDVPLAYFAVAVKGAAWTDPDSIALMVMQTMLGAWSKSAGAGKHMG
jgi:processing peptidase subunit beta